MTCTTTNIMKREIIEVRAAIMLTEEQKEQQDREATELRFPVTGASGKTTIIERRVPEYMQKLFNGITARILLQDILEIETERIGANSKITARLVIETTKETAERIKRM